jgi:hypothetical protein
VGIEPIELLAKSKDDFRKQKIPKEFKDDPEFYI